MVDATMTAVDTGTTDAELFEGATTETPVETPEVVETPTETPEPEVTGQPRDEKGKFAAKTETEAPLTETPAEKPVVDDNAPQVPSWRVREINEEKRELAAKLAAVETERQQDRDQLALLQRQVQGLQKPVEQKPETKPDPLLDPDGYEKYLEKRFEDRLLSNSRESSLRLAHRTYKDEFQTAYSAAQQAMGRGDQALAARMSSSADPGETLIEWHREQKVKQEVGNDPNAWLEKKLAERLKDPAFLAKAIETARGVASTSSTQARPVVELPPSLSTSSRAGNTSTSADDSDISDAALFRQAIR